MKLKDSTFAIIAEKQNSISHKWFNQNIKNNKHKQHVFWCHEKEYYIYDKGNFIRCTENRPKDIPIYTESEFEAILKAEQENEQYRETMDRVIAPQVLEMAKFKEENPNATEEEIEAKQQQLVLKYSPVKLGINEPLLSTGKPTDFISESPLIEKPKELTEMPTWSKTVGLEEPKVIKHRYSGAKSKKFWKIVNSIENEADRQEMYSLGVMLQRNEEYVLSQLRNLNIVAVV